MDSLARHRQVGGKRGIIEEEDGDAQELKAVISNELCDTCIGVQYALEEAAAAAPCEQRITDYQTFQSAPHPILISAGKLAVHMKG